MQPSLFDWKPPCCSIIIFPMVKRVGRIRTTAQNMLTKSTARHAESYHEQVDAGMLRHMAKAGVSEVEALEQIGAFWGAVEKEITRLNYRGQRPGGSAA